MGIAVLRVVMVNTVSPGPCVAAHFSSIHSWQAVMSSLMNQRLRRHNSSKYRK